MTTEFDLSTLSLKIRAQFFREAYSRLVHLLTVYCEGYLFLLSEQVDEAYIRLLRLCKDIVATSGFENMQEAFPSELPESLHSLGSEADVEWEYGIQPTTNSYMGKVIHFCVEVGAEQNETLPALLKNYDTLIESYNKTRLQREKQFFAKMEKQTADNNKPAQSLVPMEVVKNTRGYIERIAAQANGCYVNGWYDACAVMIRRLIETLIIECFEGHHIDARVKDPDGNFVSLENLIVQFLNEPTWNLGRDARRSLAKLPKIKGIGDLSAHNRRFIAQKDDIDRNADEIRVAIQEMIAIAFDRGSKT